MNSDEQIDLAKFIIARYDHYFESVNNKANFWLAFNTFAIGVLVSAYKDLVPLLQKQNIFWFNFGIVAFLALSILASLIILYASWPHLNTRKRASNQSRSIIYFEDVSALDIHDYRNNLDSADPARLKNDYTNQVHQLASGLSRKYYLLAIAGRTMAVGIGILAFLIVFFLFNKL